MNLMTANLILLRSAVNARCLVLPTKLLTQTRHFADDAKKENLYETLGLRSTATSNEIKKAYYDLTLKYHPDRNDNSEDAAIKFRKITEAYEILGNYGLRKKYDRGIPITRVKNVVTPPVDHKAEFQEFFDSRSAKGSSDSDSRSQEVDDLGSFSEKKERSANLDEKYDNELRSTSLVRFICAVFLCVVLYKFR